LIGTTARRAVGSADRLQRGSSFNDGARRREGPVTNSDATNDTSATRSPRRGIPLARLVLAVTVMCGAVLALDQMAAFMPRLSVDDQRTMASELAAERLDAARATKVHALDTLAQLESAIPGYPGFTRVTAVRRLHGVPDSVKFRVVTAAVSSADLTRPVRRSAIIRVD
jgi:hypothetical protein